MTQGRLRGQPRGWGREPRQSGACTPQGCAPSWLIPGEVGIPRGPGQRWLSATSRAQSPKEGALVPRASFLPSANRPPAPPGPRKRNGPCSEGHRRAHPPAAPPVPRRMRRRFPRASLTLTGRDSRARPSRLHRQDFQGQHGSPAQLVFYLLIF